MDHPVKDHHGTGVDDPQGDGPGAAQCRQRLEQMQRLVVLTINDLLSADGPSLNRRIRAALHQLGRVTGTDRTYVFQFQDEIYMNNTHEWCAQGIPPMRALLQDVPIAMAPHWWARMGSQGCHVLADLDEEPDDELRDLLAQQGIRSLLTVPLMRGPELVGFVGHDAVRAHRRFSRAEIELVRSVSNVIGTVLHRQAIETERRHAQRALAQERSRLHAMMRALPDLVLEADHDGIFTGFRQNAPMARTLEAEDVVGKSPEQTLPAPVAALARRMMRTIDRDGHAGPEEYYLDAPDGRRWFVAVGSARLAETRNAPHSYVFLVRDITHEIEQRRQIARLSAMAQQSTNSAILTDSELRVTWINAEGENRTGLTAGQVMGRDLAAVLRLDVDGKLQLRRLRDRLYNGDSVLVELCATDDDGNGWWCELGARTLRLKGDEAPSFMFILSDITQRKQSEAAKEQAAAEAQAARLRLEEAVGALRDAFVYLDRDRRMVLCNAPYRALYPRTAHAMVPGAHLHDLIAEADRNDELTHPLNGAPPASHPVARRFGTSARFESESQRPDGRWMRVVEQATADGGRVAMLVDITALKDAEARAVSDRATLLDASHEGIAFVGPSGRLTHANPAFLALFGAEDAAQVVGLHWTMVYPAAISQFLEDTVTPALRACGFWRGELHDVTGTGDDTVHDLSITRASGGMLLCILRDITRQRRSQKEQLRLREELQLAQRREVIAQLAAEMAHDFSNLLSAISGSAELIQSDRGGNAGAEHARRISAASQQASDLLRRLMALGQRNSQPRCMDLRQPVREAVDLVQASAPRSGIVQLSLPDTAVMISADPTEVMQVTLNLIINARDAVLDPAADLPRPRIAVSLRPADAADLAQPYDNGAPAPGRAYLRLEVSDSGPGMDAPTRAQAFQPYFSTKGRAGSGLGLTIVANVVNANEGLISMQSTPGQGCTAVVLWPVHRSADRPAGPAAPPARTDTLQGLRVLVVDDEDDVLAMLCAMIESAGGETAGCISGADALEALHDDPGGWDIVLTDMNMPQMTGADLARRLRQMPGQAPAIVLISALADDVLNHQVNSEIFDAVLSKPVPRAGLVSTLRRVMRPR